jgi:hypothetical protein
MGEESKSHLVLKYPETQMWIEELLQSIWLHINEEIALRNVLTVKSVIERRNLGTLA